jgi:hypothetical protein
MAVAHGRYKFITVSLLKNGYGVTVTKFVDLPPILSSSYYPPFPCTSNSREWQRYRQRT